MSLKEKTLYRVKWNAPVRGEITQQEFLGIMVEETDYNYKFLTECGVTFEIPKSLELGSRKFTITTTRNIPQEARILFLEGYRLYKRKQLLEAERNAISVEIRDIEFNLRSFKNSMDKAFGFLTLAEFTQEFFKNLTPSLQNAISKNYQFDTPCGIAYRDHCLYISRSVDIKKWFTRASFLEEEYDKTVHFTSDAAETKEYQDSLKAYRHPLQTKVPLKEALSLGDKYYLSYNGTYEMELKKPLTAEYAKELAEKFMK